MNSGSINDFTGVLRLGSGMVRITPICLGTSTDVSSELLPPEIYEAIAEADSIPALEQVILDHLTLPLRELTEHYCFAVGDPESPFVSVIEQPGPVGQAGDPLTGAGGAIWEAMLAGIGLSRRTAYMASLSPWPTLGGRALTPEEAEILKPFVRRHIALCRPKALVLLGGNLGRELLGLSGSVLDQVGTWHEYDDGEVIIPTRVILHPGFLLKEVLLKEQAWSDMLAIARVLDGEEAGIAA